MYQHLVFPLLKRTDAERAHEAVLRMLALAERTPGLQRALGAIGQIDDPRLQVDLLGLRFANPLGLAAGLDKNAVSVGTWGALGFGHVEVGTVTPEPQPGNPMPRVFRLPDDRALINRMGFPGDGMARVRRRLERLGTRRPIVGVNIGANKRSVEAGRAADDYLAALSYLHECADYLTINISSPNTARLRELQGRAALDALLTRVTARRDALPQRRPLLVKIAPDLSAAELDDVLAVCLDRGVDGIIATNTTIDRPALLRGAARTEQGGLSGAPLRDRSTAMIREIHRSTGGRLLIVGVGGVFSADDVIDKLRAGARLVQIYSALVYEGPLLARRICRDLLRMLDREGVRSIAELRPD